MRACEGCTLCCTLMGVEGADKGMREKCEHDTGSGCRIYEERPPECRAFVCLWKVHMSDVPESLFPKTLGIVLAAYTIGPTIVIFEETKFSFEANLVQLDTVMRLSGWPSHYVIVRDRVDGTRLVVGGPSGKTATYQHGPLGQRVCGTQIRWR